jgi:hypothetical protein
MGAHKFFATLWVVGALAGCSGREFQAVSDDAGGTSESASDEPSGTEGEASSEGEDECLLVDCALPSCPPQSQHTPEGECCPVCDAPKACEEGVRCDALACPGDTREVSAGCCLCEGALPECEEPALPCTDSACRGTEQESLGDGCCLCGEPLVCAADQAACDTILCGDQKVLYEDGCCRCEPEAGCGADSTACADLDCPDGVEEVGGGCCVCAELTCAQGARCELLDCAGGFVDHGDGCCECTAECDTAAGQQSCALIDCATEQVEVAAGCCVCEDAPMCDKGEAPCSDLRCDFTPTVDAGAGCCECYECASGSVACDRATCSEGFEPAPLGDGCCTCEPNAMLPECGAELIDAYDAYRADVLAELEPPPCMVDEDCVVENVENGCPVQCAVPVHHEIAGKFQEQLANWANENCSGCADTGSCDNVAAVPLCFDGVCIAEVMQ